MKAEELRIGNLIDQGPMYGVLPVDAYELYQYSLFKKGAKTAEYYKDWLPVTITEEWLLMLGFDEHETFENVFYQISGLPDKDFFWLGISVFDGYCDVTLRDMRDFESVADMNDIKYVHQLQNLFFALKGKEL